MSDHVYKIIELVGSSTVSTDDAIRNAVSRAGQSVRNLRWFHVTDTRGHLKDGEVEHFQVTIRVGFTLDGDIEG